MVPWAHYVLSLQVFYCPFRPYSVRVVHGCGLLLRMWRGLCVCVLVTTVSFNNDELIEVLFGIWTWVGVGPRNHISCGDLDLPRGRSNFFLGGLQLPVRCKL